MWTMPHRTLQVVAALIFACAIGGFVLGFAGTPQKARLPGESATVGAPIEADDAEPLSGVVAPPKPPEPPPKEEVAKTEEAAADAADSAASAALADIKPPKLVPPPATATPSSSAPEDKVGDLIDGVTPPPSDAPPY